jgi:[ribosomal protein S18]-alanine N-acetyltransferase
MALRAPRAGGPPDPAPDVSLASVSIVPMRRRHLRAVLSIEERVFPTPWSFGLYLSELAQPAVRGYFVALAGGDVVGYGGLMMVLEEAHITTIGVAPAWQRLGIGRMLLLHLALDARRRGADHLTLEVRVSNAAAQGLYREFGFAPAGIRKNYYSEIREDALVMWANDIGSEEYSQRLAAIAARVQGPRRAAT